MNELKWTSEKPEISEECLLITYSFGAGYRLWETVKVEMEVGWYFALLEVDGNEWGDYIDLKAEKYCLLKPLTRQFKEV